MRSSNNILKVVASIGLICALTPRADCIGFRFLMLGSKYNVDFDKFDKWLTEGLPNNDDPQANLDYVRNNQEQLTNVRVKRSAKIFAAFLGGEKCNSDMLMYARDMRRNKVDVDGPKRYQRLMKSIISRVFEMCSEYIGSELKKEYDSKEATSPILREFLRVVAYDPHRKLALFGWHSNDRSPKNFLNYTLDPRNFELSPYLIHWKDHLTDLAMIDKFSNVVSEHVDRDTKLVTTTFNQTNFNYIYKKYLIEPCTSLKSVADIFKGVCAMAELWPTEAGALKLTSTNQSIVLQYMYAYKACLHLESKGQQAVDFIRDNIKLGLDYGHLYRETDGVPTA